MPASGGSCSGQQAWQDGHSGLLNRMISSVPLHCGSVVTEATDVFVGTNLSCDLLLGRPWQRGNLVTIDERIEGTYLVFKDRKTGQPRYKIFITPEHIIPETFEPFKKGKSFQPSVQQIPIHRQEIVTHRRP